MPGICRADLLFKKERSVSNEKILYEVGHLDWTRRPVPPAIMGFDASWIADNP